MVIVCFSYVIIVSKRYSIRTYINLHLYTSIAFKILRSKYNDYVISYC